MWEIEQQLELLFMKTSIKGYWIYLMDQRINLKKKLNVMRCPDEYFNQEMEFVAYEVNYANWESFEKILRKENIEFDKEWDDGGDYEGGISSYRYLDGEWKTIEEGKTDTAIAELLKLLLESADIRKVAENQLKLIRPYEIKPLSDGKTNGEKFIEKIKE